MIGGDEEAPAEIVDRGQDQHLTDPAGGGRAARPRTPRPAGPRGPIRRNHPGSATGQPSPRPIWPVTRNCWTRWSGITSPTIPTTSSPPGSPPSTPPHHPHHHQERLMTDIATTPSTTSTRSSGLRTAARWMVTFVGFPAGGLVAELVVGPVDSIAAALIGGLITGVFIGAAQWWGLGSSQRPPRPGLLDRRHRNRFHGRTRGRRFGGRLRHRPSDRSSSRARSAVSRSVPPRLWCSVHGSADWRWRGRRRSPRSGPSAGRSPPPSASRSTCSSPSSARPARIVVTALTAVLPFTLNRR